MEKDNQYWREHLTSEQYEILRMKGTEPPGSGKFLHNHDSGMYMCAACGAQLFRSDAKFDSGSGWPSFSDAITENIEIKEDLSHNMTRIEVMCKKCGSHLGHLFPDGPNPSGQRYCVNSMSLGFEPDNN